MNKTNIMNGYVLLNTIKPKYYQTEYPYNSYNITFTKKIIDILVKTQKEKSSKKTGASELSICIYH